jgi:hypothetical protein
VVKALGGKANLSACKKLNDGEVSLNCQRRKARPPGTSGADSFSLHQDTTWNNFLLE